MQVFVSLMEENYIPRTNDAEDWKLLIKFWKFGGIFLWYRSSLSKCPKEKIRKENFCPPDSSINKSD